MLLGFLLGRLRGAHLGGNVRLEVFQRRDLGLLLGLPLLGLARLLLPAEPRVLGRRERRGSLLRVRRAHHPFPPSSAPSFVAAEAGERDVGLPEHVVAERVLDGARRRELRDGIRVPDGFGRGRIGRRHHRRGRLMVVGRYMRARRLPSGGRRDGIFRLGTRPGRRRRRRRRRGGSRLRLVLHRRPPGRAGMRRDRRPEPPRAGVPRRRVRGGGDRQEAGWAIPPRPSHRSRRVRPRPWERRDRPRRPQREPRQPGCEARRPALGPHASERAAPRALHQPLGAEPAITSSSSFGIFPRARVDIF